MKNGEIWLASFPLGVGHEYKKERPVLIIESNKNLNNTNIITIMPFTSNINNCINGDILVRRNKLNYLFKDSIIKTHHIYSLDASRFIKRIGIIDKDIMDNVKTFLKQHFCID